MVLGTKPIILRLFQSKGVSNVFACSDHPTIIHSSNHKLLFSNVNVKVCSTLTHALAHSPTHSLTHPSTHSTSVRTCVSLINVVAILIGSAVHVYSQFRILQRQVTLRDGGMMHLRFFFQPSLALVDSSTLVIGSVDQIQMLHIDTISLGESPK